MGAMPLQDRERLEKLKAQQRLCTERNYKLQVRGLIINDKCWGLCSVWVLAVLEIPCRRPPTPMKTFCFRASQEAEQSSKSAYSVLCRILLPFRKTVGLALLLLVLLMLLSLGTVLVRRLRGSACGWSCGFAVAGAADPPTPADATLLFLSSVGLPERLECL